MTSIEPPIQVEYDNSNHSDITVHLQDNQRDYSLYQYIDITHNNQRRTFIRRSLVTFNNSLFHAFQHTDLHHKQIDLLLLNSNTSLLLHFATKPRTT